MKQLTAEQQAKREESKAAKKELLSGLASLLKSIPEDEKEVLLDELNPVNNLDDHFLSERNRLLLHFQTVQRNMKECSTVAGFNAWKSINRTIKKGEKGLLIIRPNKKISKNDNAPVQSQVMNFEAGSSESNDPNDVFFFGVYVFDIQQTEEIITDNDKEGIYSNESAINDILFNQNINDDSTVNDSAVNETTFDYFDYIKNKRPDLY